jgi:hypothetical protein
MSQTLNLSNEETDALDRIDAELQSVSTATGAKAAALGVEDLCEKYHAIRKWLELLVEGLKKLPGPAKKIAAAIEFLMSLADIACPV